MKVLFLTMILSLVSGSVFAQQTSPRYEGETDYRTPVPPRHGNCGNYSCPPPRPYPRPVPAPREYRCDVSMLDCYNRPVTRYWGKGPQYQGACQVAMNLCRYDLRWYGQYGSRCVILGK